MLACCAMQKTEKREPRSPLPAVNCQRRTWTICLAFGEFKEVCNKCSMTHSFDIVATLEVQKSEAIRKMKKMKKTSQLHAKMFLSLQEPSRVRQDSRMNKNHHDVGKKPRTLG